MRTREHEWCLETRRCRVCALPLEEYTNRLRDVCHNHIPGVVISLEWYRHFVGMRTLRRQLLASVALAVNE